MANWKTSVSYDFKNIEFSTKITRFTTSTWENTQNDTVSDIGLSIDLYEYKALNSIRKHNPKN